MQQRQRLLLLLKRNKLYYHWELLRYKRSWNTMNAFKIISLDYSLRIRSRDSLGPRSLWLCLKQLVVKWVDFPSLFYAVPLFFLQVGFGSMVLTDFCRLTGRQSVIMKRLQMNTFCPFNSPSIHLQRGLPCPSSSCSMCRWGLTDLLKTWQPSHEAMILLQAKSFNMWIISQDSMGFLEFLIKQETVPSLHDASHNDVGR